MLSREAGTVTPKRVRLTRLHGWCNAGVAGFTDSGGDSDRFRQLSDRLSRQKAALRWLEWSMDDGVIVKNKKIKQKN